MEKQISAKQYILTQQISYFDYSPEKVQEVLEGLKGSPKWAWILHDKDGGEAHIHAWIEYEKKKNLAALVNELAVLKVPENNIEYAKSKIGCLAYLTHSTDKSKTKYQYDKSEIRSNFDIDAERAEEFRINPALRAIYDKIESREINEWNLEQKLDMATCVKFDKEIKRAFDYMRKRYGMGADRNMQVIYVWGDSGCGKTTFAKWLAKENGMSFFVSSASNDILDGYRGEECIILDDLRADNMRLEEFLKLADNHTNSSVRSRYYNKSIATCKMMIITCCKSPAMFYKDFENTQYEQTRQFFRRVGLVYHIIQSDEVRGVGIADLSLRIQGSDASGENTELYQLKIPLPNVPTAKFDFMEKFKVNPFGGNETINSDTVPF